MEPLLGMPAGSLPRRSAELDTYMHEMLAGEHIVVTDAGRSRASGRWPGRDATEPIPAEP